jgi:LacI family transcriptional regulator
MRLKKCGTINNIPKIILLLEMSHAAGRKLLRGIIGYSRLHGSWKFYRTPPFYTEDSNRTKAFAYLKQIDADGIIAQGTSEIIAANLPAICIDIRTKIPGQPNITGDNLAAAKMAAAHLIDRGLRHFAYCGFDDINWSVERSENFTEYLTKAGFEVRHYCQPLSHRQRLWKNEREILAQWLKTLPKPVGIMACNDDRAIQVAEACRIVDIKVPDEIAIIGVDNDELACELCDPPLSSVAFDFECAGFEAAALLEKMIHDKKTYPETIIIKATHVVTRQSTDILAVDDPSIADALRFIKNNARKMMLVEEIADAVAIARRSLEKRFRNKLGRSVHEEIVNVRMDLVAQMLIETNISIENIALAFGYSEVNNLSRCFRKVKGVNPLAFRKQFRVT